MPAASRIFDTAIPDAPAPQTTARIAPSSLPTTRAALRSAASATIAVPCWSSCMTGMSSMARSRSSISKQRGAEMSSRLMPPKLGASAATTAHHVVDVGDVDADGHRVDAGELLEQQRLALHDGHRGGRADVAEAEHGGAVAHHGDGVAHPGVLAGELGLVGDRAADPGDARRVGHGERGPVGHVHAGLDADLAAPVHGEHRVIVQRRRRTGKGSLVGHGNPQELGVQVTGSAVRPGLRRRGCARRHGLHGRDHSRYGGCPLVYCAMSGWR